MRFREVDPEPGKPSRRCRLDDPIFCTETTEIHKTAEFFVPALPPRGVALRAAMRLGAKASDDTIPPRRRREISAIS